jgi:hypothetical protein
MAFNSAKALQMRSMGLSLATAFVVVTFALFFVAWAALGEPFFTDLAMLFDFSFMKNLRTIDHFVRVGHREDLFTLPATNVLYQASGASIALIGTRSISPDHSTIPCVSVELFSLESVQLGSTDEAEVVPS